MATNEFLPFANAPDANVVAQAVYEQAAWRARGFASGMALSDQLNKAWRQASIMGSVLAQFMCDRTGEDILDNGDPVRLLRQLQDALFRNVDLIGDATAVTQPKFDASRRIATTEFVANALGNLTGVVRDVTSRALSGQEAGTLFIAADAPAIVLELPPSADVAVGAVFQVQARSHAVTVAAASGMVLLSIGGSGNGYTLGARGVADFVYIGGNTVAVLGDSLSRYEFDQHLAAPDPHPQYATEAQLVAVDAAVNGRIDAVQAEVDALEVEVANKSDIGHTHTAAELGYAGSRGVIGWRRCPDGTIEQWGRVTGVWAEGTGPSITFPIAFPNACESVTLTNWNRTGGGTGQWISIDCFGQVTGDPTTTGFGTFVQKPGDSDNFWEGCFWTASGY